MRTREFLSKLDHQAIVRAIAGAEAKTSGQIRVYLQRGALAEDAVAAAKKQFHKLGMDKTSERNGVLILVAPRARKFAVVGDEGIHQKLGEIYWQQLVDAMSAHFQKANFNQALLEAIERTGELLAKHFPKTESGSNELPDEVIEG